MREVNPMWFFLGMAAALAAIVALLVSVPAV